MMQSTLQFDKIPRYQYKSELRLIHSYDGVKMEQTASDDTLNEFSKLQEGDETAFRAYYDRYYGLVHLW